MSNWIISKKNDIFWFFIPVWITWGVCFALPSEALSNDIPLWIWVVVVLGIDVGHVWTTIYRTYMSVEGRKNHKRVLIITPLFAFTFFFLLAWWSISAFWTVLAYLAVYHFIKQQYGFMQIYRAKNRQFLKKWLSDKFIIYFSMLYPVIYWHISPDRNFQWFVEGDFLNLAFLSDSLQWIITGPGVYMYISLLVFWLAEDIYRYRKQGLATGKILWIVTTAGNWFLGIVYFNSDLAFTVTNVVAHGIPYFALVFFYLRSSSQLSSSNHKKLITIPRLAMMVGFVLLLAFFEEYFWDMLVYRDNEPFFSSILQYPFDMAVQPGWVAVFMGLLVVPQVSHYIFDGFIWKANEKNPDLKEILLH